eukprot:CAMPEP_0201496320 /NCGR_PEP_ID=MMETSP0151_2-20130828/59162_1 /ASSEMBLY_ACC=CAM_ASM_000257 /TAXON_ID=200890 /ORGANISM="Paramoeba atlantica, Strain 621/1 / CCAP 1560/9" /LENGTH=60 /DNA_ID=CAMNT_0047886047 /DNA_START=125 /DNA_END=303 /DNA_ORIENTATION=-
MNIQTADGMTALHLAASKNFEEIMKILIEYGSSIDIQTKNGATALHKAAYRGFEGIVKIL